MLHEQHTPSRPLSAFVSEAQQDQFPTGYFLLSNSTEVSVISSVVKLHLLMMTSIIPKRHFVCVLNFSDRVDYDYYTENLLFSSHILFGGLAHFASPHNFLCDDGYKGNGYTRNTEKVTRKIGDKTYYVKHPSF